MNEFIELKIQKNDIYVDKPASEESIKILEKNLDIKLPKDYKKFLSVYGRICDGDSCISGIVKDDPLKMSGGGIYADTIYMRETFEINYDVPNYLLVLEKHEDGAYCFNTSIRTIGDEYGIVNYEPHLPERTYSEILANTFLEYIEKWFFFDDEEET